MTKVEGHVWFFLVRLLKTEGEGCMRGFLVLGVTSLVFVVSGFPEFGILHRFFKDNERATVNDDGLGGTALDPRVWSVALLPTRRRVRESVRNCAMLPGPRGLWTGNWGRILVAVISAQDVAPCPVSVGMLVTLSSFRGSLHRPSECDHLGVGGVSFLE